MDVGPPRAPRLERVLLGDFVAELDRRAAVEPGVGLLVVQRGAVRVGGWAFGVAGGRGLGGGEWRAEGCGEGAQAAERWGFGEGHCGEGRFCG